MITGATCLITGTGASQAARSTRTRSLEPRSRSLGQTCMGIGRCGRPLGPAPLLGGGRCGRHVNSFHFDGLAPCCAHGWSGRGPWSVRSWHQRGEASGRCGASNDASHHDFRRLSRLRRAEHACSCSCPCAATLQRWPPTWVQSTLVNQNASESSLDDDDDDDDCVFF